uniref:EOG090X0AQP n=1 Tax=Daphnia hispanica TaxID=575233 RepID=A0A4Y7M3Y0_9CRUS|nr:EOG090X0AQP [Daphnia hispanica]
MATRSITEIFILMRNNAIQSRNFYSEQISDTDSLVQHDQDAHGKNHATHVRMPPDWTDSLEEAQYTLTKIQTRLKELSILQNKHLLKPTFDDSMNEEQQIDVLTQDITKMFTTCHNCIKRIQYNNTSPSLGQSETNLAKNVVTSLVTTLQNLSNTFRSDQNTYLNKIKSREERSQQFFGGASSKDWNYDDWTTTSSQIETPRVLSQQQLMLHEENSSFVELREKEIQNVVRSIYELNSIFKEISHMVADQGTVLDRIDYNIEHTQAKVHDGLVHLQKADNYQKKNRKMVCIVGMVSAIIFLIIILIAVKS